ncbi:TonB-dependent siderophore receptor [Pseudomonas sp. FME51]|uniref:TonB-dependent siderophore receptor n=1 Tax=Pseudomonas sp. FME51 TaxID=2742609 RepID=UPI001868CAAD|nr:TonB-dependent receptor [Pseudomonas sp. FME51]
MFVPYVGIVHDLNDIWALYASYTKIFNPQPTRYRDINYLPLDPEEGISYEAGVKASFYDGRLNASLSLYKTDLDNKAAWYSGSDRTIYYTADGTETEGVEFEINGELAEGWQLATGYSYNDIRDRNDDRLVTFVPMHRFKLFSTYRLPGAFNKITIGGGVDWRSNRKYGSDTLSSFAVANAMTRYDISENLSASLHVKNLFDKKYLEEFNQNFQTGMYGMPRSFMVSLKYNY